MFRRHPEWHIIEDIYLVLNSFRFYTQDRTEHFVNDWDLMIAHPPCTFLADSGVRWLYEKDELGIPFLYRAGERFNEMDKAYRFFNMLLSADIPLICIENPIPHKHAQLPKYSQLIQPWQFGHGETKATCLWLKGLPHLKPTNIVEGREQRIWKLPPSEDRAKLRSKTFPGIAAAMAAQWG